MVAKTAPAAEAVTPVAASAADATSNQIEEIVVTAERRGCRMFYGRNADGGLISIITRTPKSTPSFVGSVGYGNYETFTGTAYETGALTDLLIGILRSSRKNSVSVSTRT